MSHVNQLGNGPSKKLLFVPPPAEKIGRDPWGLRDLDRKLVHYGRRVLVLKSLKWPWPTKKKFLEGWRRKNPVLPTVSRPDAHFEKERRALVEVARACAATSHPIADYLKATAESYVTAIDMIDHAGTPAFTELSRQLYGLPGDPMGWDELTHLDAADHFVSSTKELISSYIVPEKAYTLTPEAVADRIRERIQPHFAEHPVELLVEPHLPSKACAGARRIRLRGNARFSEIEVEQLIQHEAYVHMLTTINGKEQRRLRSLGLPAPRTAKTQEGLATFAELMTGTMDLDRLLRLALRIKAVQFAIDGADFIDVFKFFLGNNQTPDEAFYSAQRIFRGGDVRGKVVFTKDVIYLQGLILAHTFFRKAVAKQKFYLAQHLFSGRMALSDAISLEPFFASGYIKAPTYLPPWLMSRERFAAQLCYYVFANKINLSEVRLKDFFVL